jgi:hypothetical protein
MKKEILLYGCLKTLFFIGLLIIVWKHSHWSVALILTLQFVKFEFPFKDPIQMKDKNPSNHHVIPRSKKGKTRPDNLDVIEREKHLRYHELFENRTPEEILDYLVNYFWKSKDGQNGMRFINKFLKI